MSTGIALVDDLAQRGFPIEAVTEPEGERCSGRTSLALSFLSKVASEGKVRALIDASDTFNPVAADSAGVNHNRLLRCGVREAVTVQEKRTFALPSACFAPKPAIKGLHGGGHGAHPRTEVLGFSEAVNRFLSDETVQARCAESNWKPRPIQQSFEPNLLPWSPDARLTHLTTGFPGLFR